MTTEPSNTPLAFSGHLSLRYWFVILAIASLFCPYIAYRYRVLPPESRPTMLLWLGIALGIGTAALALQLRNMARVRSRITQAGERIALSSTKVGNKWTVGLIVLLIPCLIFCVCAIIHSAEPQPKQGMSFMMTYNLVVFSAMTGINLVTVPGLVRSIHCPVAIHEHGLVGAAGFAKWKFYRSYRVQEGDAQSILHLRLWHGLVTYKIEIANEDCPAVISVLQRNGLAPHELIRS